MWENVDLSRLDPEIRRTLREPERYADYADELGV
jgi:hypothetical protein